MDIELLRAEEASMGSREKGKGAIERERERSRGDSKGRDSLQEFIKSDNACMGWESSRHLAKRKTIK